MAIWVFLLSLYTSFMTFPVDRVSFPLPDKVLSFMSRLFLLVLPAKVEGRAPKLTHTRVLFVVNHNVLGFDFFTLWAIIWLKTGIYPRGLTDRFHFKVPFWAHFLNYAGALTGDRRVCDQAMAKGFPLLVFPGGSNEACRKKGFKKYSLDWGNRAGFARMALKHGICLPSFAMNTLFELVSNFE